MKHTMQQVGRGEKKDSYVEYRIKQWYNQDELASRSRISGSCKFLMFWRKYDI